MNANLLRRVNWLWKHRHTHDGDTTQSQVQVIRTIVEEQADGISGASSGAYIHLSSVGQSIAAGGEDVEWEQVDSLGVFAFNPTFSTTTVRIPRAGYYNLAVTILEWESWQFGGDVSIWRNDTKVWPPLGDTAWSSDARSVWHPDSSHAIWFDHGDTFRLFIDHGSASAQTLAHIALSAYLVDRRTGPPEPWELVFAANNWGVVRVGSNWWTTDASDNVNPALFERAADGTILNAYPGYDGGIPGGTKRNRGIAFADGFLWGVGWEHEVHKVDPADGSLVSAFNAEDPSPGGAMRDMTWNGTHLVGTESTERFFKKYTTTGHVSDHATPSGLDVWGVAWDGTGYWGTVAGGDEIIHMDAAFNIDSTLSGPPAPGLGAEYLGGYVYVMTNRGLYRRAV